MNTASKCGSRGGDSSSRRLPKSLLADVPGVVRAEAGICAPFIPNTLEKRRTSVPSSDDAARTAGRDSIAASHAAIAG